MDSSKIYGKYLPAGSFFASFNTRAGNAKEYVEPKEYFKPVEKEKFFWRTFSLYAGITTACVMSIFVFGNFPDSYIEGSGLTPFKVTSEYIICFILLCSLIVLYTKKDRFEERVFKLLAASIVATIFGELAFTLYTNVTDFSNLIGHFLKVLSFYFIYQAVIRTGFDDPYTLLFRELKQSEEALRQEATFLRDDKGRIYNILGVKKR